MRALIASVVAGAALLAGAAQAAPRHDPELRLAKLLDGRVAGEPRDCVPLRNTTRSHVIDGTAIVFDIGGTRWVNRPRAGAEDLDRSDTLVYRTTISRLCSVDVVRTFDTSARIQTGVVFLGEWVPYRKVRQGG